MSPPNPVEVINVYGRYGGVFGIILGSLIAIIVINMILAYLRQRKFDDAMMQSLQRNTEAMHKISSAMNHLGDVVGRMPCTHYRPNNVHDNG